eukprot:Clim_evm58s152 gene=Clim_evmTU58s152
MIRRVGLTALRSSTMVKRPWAAQLQPSTAMVLIQSITLQRNIHSSPVLWKKGKGGKGGKSSKGKKNSAAAADFEDDAVDIIDTDDLKQEFQDKMDAILKKAKEEVAKVRGGRLTAQTLANYEIWLRSGRKRLADIAQVGQRDPNNLVIQPMDPSLSNHIIESLVETGIGTMPVRSENGISVAVPKWVSTEQLTCYLACC